MVNLSIPSWLKSISHKKSTRLRLPSESSRLFHLPAIPFSTPSYSTSPSRIRSPMSPPLSPKSPPKSGPPSRPVSPVSLEQWCHGSESPPPSEETAEVWEPPTPPLTPVPVSASVPAQTPETQGAEARKAEMVRFFAAPEGRVGEGWRLQGVAIAREAPGAKKRFEFEEENRRLMDDEDWDGGGEGGFRFWGEKLKQDGRNGAGGGRVGGSDA